MAEVTPIPKTGRYRRQPRNPQETALYLDNVERRMQWANRHCELQLPRVCTVEAVACHHVYPQRLGRDDSFENLRATCESCNQMVESMGKQSAAALGLYSAHPLGLLADPDPEEAT